MAVAFNLPGVGVSMIAWIAAKMAAGWNMEKGAQKSGRWAALMGGLMSMMSAMIGGLICAGRLVW